MSGIVVELKKVEVTKPASGVGFAVITVENPLTSDVLVMGGEYLVEDPMSETLEAIAQGNGYSIDGLSA